MGRSERAGQRRRPAVDWLLGRTQRSRLLVAASSSPRMMFLMRPGSGPQGVSRGIGLFLLQIN
jgi:hypothetical protein